MAASEGRMSYCKTGTRAACDPLLAWPNARPLTHIEALDLAQVPAQLIVLGGGYVRLDSRRRCAGSVARSPSSITMIVCA